MPYKQINPNIDLSVRSVCVRSYPNHPKGCPNFGKKKGCPPQVSIITDILDFTKPIYAIWNIFDFESHCNRMRKLHPNWTQRQVECCLYWQPKARKQLKIEIGIFLDVIKNQTILTCPEGNGVNITETMASIGQFLQWPPRTFTYQVVLAGNKLKG